jgi:simple sugar transport system ATP-binding protein
MLHQDPLDFPPMRIVDNFILGAAGGLFPNRAAIIREFKLLAEEYGFSIDPETYVDSLTVGERQQLEILRLLWLGARVLILDEPTTGISSTQKEKLFATLRKLAGEGKTMIFVSHKLEDVEVLCHQAVVLRQGKLIGEMKKPFDPKKLVGMMFDKEVSLGARQAAKPGEAVLSIQHVSLEDIRLKIKDVSLEVHAGEVIGLAGMEGSGQGSFLRACAGLMRPVGGKVILKALSCV